MYLKNLIVCNIKKVTTQNINNMTPPTKTSFPPEPTKLFIGNMIAYERLCKIVAEIDISMLQEPVLVLDSFEQTSLNFGCLAQFFSNWIRPIKQHCQIC